MPSLTILHTNDLHNRLTPEKAARLRELKASHPGSLLLDAGDAIWAGNIVVRPGGEPALRLMTEAGYDAMALGNREFHFLSSGLRAKIGWARFPVLCANVRPTGSAELPVAIALELQAEGLRIAVFGLTVPMITERMLASRVSDYVFDDPISTAERIVPDLRRSADVVVALTHIGLTRDRELAAAVRGIDLIVGGHSHDALKRPETIESTPIVQAGWFAHSVGKVTLTPGGAVESELLAL